MMKDILRVASIKFMEKEFFCEDCVLEKCRDPFERSEKRSDAVHTHLSDLYKTLNIFS